LHRPHGCLRPTSQPCAKLSTLFQALPPPPPPPPLNPLKMALHPKSVPSMFFSSCFHPLLLLSLQQIPPEAQTIFSPDLISVGRLFRRDEQRVSPDSPTTSPLSRALFGHLCLHPRSHSYEAFRFLSAFGFFLQENFLTPLTFTFLPFPLPRTRAWHSPAAPGGPPTYPLFFLPFPNHFCPETFFAPTNPLPPISFSFLSTQRSWIPFLTRW